MRRDLSQDREVLAGLDSAVDNLSNLFGSSFGKRVGGIDGRQRDKVLEEIEDRHTLS
jgi:hypothetical protein